MLTHSMRLDCGIFHVPGEWVVDGDGYLLLRLPTALASVDIDTLSIRGKVQTYAMALVEY